MLISITTTCNMQCTHCMDDANPYQLNEYHDNVMDYDFHECPERYMRFDTFVHAFDTFMSIGGMECVITGGEPMENPLFWEFIKYAVNTIRASNELKHVTVTTNGMYLFMEDQTTCTNFKELEEYESESDILTFQITNDKRYYSLPYRENSNVFNKITGLGNVIFVDDIGDTLYPQGRAIKNYSNICTAKAPKCFNIRSAVRSLNDLKAAINVLNLHGKFCTPQIACDGSIKLGESNLCPVCSNINKSMNEVISDIIDFKCSGCKMILDKMPDELLKAIGENKDA